VIPEALKEWGENASDNLASLSRRLSILAASIRVAGRFPSFRILPKAIGKRSVGWPICKTRYVQILVKKLLQIVVQRDLRLFATFLSETDH
jgi:hypothetical protein